MLKNKKLIAFGVIWFILIAIVVVAIVVILQVSKATKAPKVERDSTDEVLYRYDLSEEEITMVNQFCADMKEQYSLEVSDYYAEDLPSYVTVYVKFTDESYQGILEHSLETGQWVAKLLR